MLEIDSLSTILKSVLLIAVDTVITTDLELESEHETTRCAVGVGSLKSGQTLGTSHIILYQRTHLPNIDTGS